MAMLDS